MHFNDSYIVLNIFAERIKDSLFYETEFCARFFSTFLFRRPNRQLPVFMFPTIKFALSLCASIDDRELDGKTFSLCAIYLLLIWYVHSAGSFRSKLSYNVVLYLCSHVNDFTLSSVRL